MQIANTQFCLQRRGRGLQHKVDLNKNMSMSEASIEIVNGESVKFKLSEVDYHVATFSNQKILEHPSLTIGQYFETVRSHPVRWYLHTKMKVYICMLPKTLFGIHHTRTITL